MGKVRREGVGSVHGVCEIASKFPFLQEVLSSKESELVKCREKVEGLQGQLRALERHSNHATSIKLKKVRTYVRTCCLVGEE